MKTSINNNCFGDMQNIKNNIISQIIFSFYNYPYVKQRLINT